MTPDIRSFATKEEAGTALADAVASDLRQAVAARGQAALAVPGGRSPIPFFAALFPRPLPWPEILLTLTDDRWVAPDSPDSNQRLVTEAMTGTPAAASRFLPLVNAATTPAAGQAATAQALKCLPSLFDAVVLGLGDDGHVASLFPGQVLDAGAPCLPGLAPVMPHQRISLGLQRLLATRRMYFLFGGDHRLGLLRRPAADLPLAAVLSGCQAPVQVFHYA